MNKFTCFCHHFAHIQGTAQDDRIETLNNLNVLDTADFGKNPFLLELLRDRLRDLHGRTVAAGIADQHFLLHI